MDKLFNDGSKRGSLKIISTKMGIKLDNNRTTRRLNTSRIQPPPEMIDREKAEIDEKGCSFASSDDILTCPARVKAAEPRLHLRKLIFTMKRNERATAGLV
jgi:hypothetical protein